jgi:DNA modification methylase
VKPYYEDDSAVLYLADCREVLPEIDPVDVLVTDPPYGVEFQSNRRAEQFDLIPEDDDPVGMTALVSEIINRKMKRGRHAYVFGPFDFGPLVAAGIVQEPVALIWDKSMFGMGNLQIPWASQHEDIQFIVAVKSKANVAKGDGRLTARLRRGNILRYQRPNAAGVLRHPTEKPVGLLRELIEASSCVGETVLDPFAGSGSTLVAAALSGRKSIGVEVTEKWAETAAQRLSALRPHLEALRTA